MTCVDCGASTNLASADGKFRCWKCHCSWLSARSCSTAPSSSRGLASVGHPDTKGDGGSKSRGEAR